MKGRTIRLFLVDGSPTGILTAEIMNWTGQVIIAPRTRLRDLVDREQIKRTGIYILSGEGESIAEREIIYIGESNNVWKRVLQHTTSDKDFWNKVVFVTSKDDNLTKAHVSYLESRLIDIAKKTRRADLQNDKLPTPIPLPEADVADMEFFLAQIQILLPVLGLNFSIALPEIDAGEVVEIPDAEESPTFYMTYGGVAARAKEVGSEFVVLKGTTIRKRITKSIMEIYIRMREKLLEESLLEDSDNDEYWVVKENIPFSSPSSAASVISGAQRNGREEWKVEGSYKTYAEWQQEILGELE